MCTFPRTYSGDQEATARPRANRCKRPIVLGPKGKQLSRSSFIWHFNRAIAEAGRPDLTPHSLRHTGATMAAQGGATVAELMRGSAYLPQMAMRYQHASAERDKVIAGKLSARAAAHRDSRG